MASMFRPPWLALRGELSGEQRKEKSSVAIECLMDDSDLSQPGSIVWSTNSMLVSDAELQRTPYSFSFLR